MAPTGGALTVNTVAASGGGTQSYDDDGAFTIGVRTDYTDATSGLASSTLTREQGTLNADACSAYGAPTTLVGTPAQSGLATGCYRYVLTGTDNVGNTSTVTTVVKVDTSAPAAPGLVLSDSSADVHTTGTTPSTGPPAPAPSTSPLRPPTASPGSSTTTSRRWPASPVRARAPTRTYTLATPTEPNGAKPVTARNQALLSSSATNFTLTSDSAVPVSGALTVNTVAASGGGTQSYDDDGAFTIGVRTDYTDALSGIATSTLTREQGTLQRGRLLGLRRPHDARRHPGPERPCHRLLPLRPHRHRQRRQLDVDHHGGQGRHQRAGRTRPRSLGLERRRPHHRHDRLLPPGRLGLL